VQLGYLTPMERTHVATTQNTRRELLKSGLALAGLGIIGVPEWMLPALAQGETLVPFTDLPEKITLAPTPDRRIIDIRTISGPITPAEQFFTTQHYGHPEVDTAAYRLKITGLVDRPRSFSLAELRKMKSSDLVAGFECSGNRRPLQGLASNGRWTGVPLKAVLDQAGVKAQAREVVFFGADHGEEEVEFRTQKFKVDQQYGRSMTREQVQTAEPFLAYALNGEPLTRHQGAPLRLIVPGWYGAPNVKWLTQIHAQEDQYLGKYQARWYRTLRGEMIDGEMKWKEAAITEMQLKSFIARVSKDGDRHKVLGVILNDGTPITSVEVKVDEGPWHPAVLDPSTKEKYSWKLFTYTWNGAAPGEHTLVSRVTDARGTVQPTAEELEVKKTFLEDNSQHPRKVLIS
jgi:DMSO/TMAO reductase YedYZ molybdopterin-dependent catalytic subunit